MEKENKKKNLKKLMPKEDHIGVSVPQLIDRATWEAAQKLLEKNANNSRRNNNVNQYLLRGLVVCGECGSMCSGHVSNKKAYYSCGAKRNKNITTKPHDDVRIATRQKPFDTQVWQGLSELLQDPANIQKQIEKRLPKASKISKATREDQTKIEKKLAKLDIQEKRILDAYREAIIEIDDLREQKAKIAQERADLKKQQKAAQSKLEGSERHEITLDTLGDMSARFERAMAKADFATREKITNLLVHSVILRETKAVVKGSIPVTTPDALTMSPFQPFFFFLHLLNAYAHKNATPRLPIIWSSKTSLAGDFATPMQTCKGNKCSSRG